MKEYGLIAVNSANLVISGKISNPRNAWKICAKEVFKESISLQNKPCPMSTFLGLCQGGYIIKIPIGYYTRSIKNKKYGVDALTLLYKDPLLKLDQESLWKKVTDGREITHNSQMEVVIALWNAEMLRIN